MHNLRQSGDGGALRPLQVNLEVLRRHVDHDHYVRVSYPEDLFPTGTAAKGVLTGKVPITTLPDAVVSAVTWTLHHGSEWLDGVIETRIYYTGDINGAGTVITTNLLATKWKAGANIPGTAATINTNLNLTSPTTAGDEMVRLHTQYLRINAGDIASGWVLSRVGNAGIDTYNGGAMQLLRIVQRYIPGQQER